MEEDDTLIEPGLYHVNMRGATMGECWRIRRNIIGFLIMFCWKLVGAKMGYTWFPLSEVRRDCSFDELGIVTKEKLAPLVEQAKTFGYKEGEFTKVTKTFNKNAKETGSYVALHENRNLVLIIGYVRIINELLPERIIERTSINLVFALDEMKFVGAHNNDFILENGGISRGVYVHNGKLEDIVKKCNEELQKTKSPIITFRDFSHYDDVSDKIEKKTFLFHVNRGYYQKADSQTQESVLKEYGYV
jgi:hypothetical protein